VGDPFDQLQQTDNHSIEPRPTGIRHMLRPEDICRLVQATSKTLTLADGQAAYGIASGQAYAAGRTKLDPRDRGGRVLVYWKATPVNANTPFFGRPPTPDNVFAVEAALLFEVVEPRLLLRQLPHGEECLTRDRFAQDVRDHLKKTLSRLACKYNPTDLVGGPAQQAGTAEVAGELNRVYAVAGFHVAQVVLKDISSLVQQHQLDLLARQIEIDAREKGIAIDQAYRDSVRDIRDAAEDDPQARDLATRIASAASFDQLKELAAQEMAETPEADSKKYAECAARMTEPVITGNKGQCLGYFAVLSGKHSPDYFQIVRPWFFVGRDANCHVTLPVSAASSLHATIARIGSGLAIIDHASTAGTIHNGERIAQRFIETGDVFRLGDHWMVFKLEPGREDREVAESLRGSIASSGRTIPGVNISADMFEPGAGGNDISAIVQLFSSSGENATTESRPLLIGRDSVCDLRLEGCGVARFHAVVYWDAPVDGKSNQIGEAGVFVEDLHSGRGTVRNGHPIGRERLADGDVLEVGGHRITINLVGNVRKRAEALHAARPEQGDLAITSVDDAAEGKLLRFALSHERVVLGRDRECDVVFDCEEISGRHAEIARSPEQDATHRPSFTIADLASTNGTLLNGSKLKPGEPHRLRPGDIIRLGTGRHHRDLLVHHDL